MSSKVDNEFARAYAETYPDMLPEYVASHAVRPCGPGAVVYVHDGGPGGVCRVEKRSMRTSAEVEALARSIAEQVADNAGIEFGEDHRPYINEEGVALIAAHLIDRAGVL